jgi:hypothetical protein
MNFYYGEQMPLRILDEAEFWKHQEKEHTVVIRQAINHLEKEYVDALNEWEKAISKTQQTVVSYIETVIRSQYVYEQIQEQVIQLITYCFEESMKFTELCSQIKNHSAAAKDNIFAKTLLSHIIRESEYFIGIARVILYGKQ